MTDTERVLLDNTFDALDRLFDGQSEVVDTYAFTYATAQALTESAFFSHFDEAARRLQTIVRTNPHREEARELALNATNELRTVVAAALATD